MKFRFFVIIAAAAFCAACSQTASSASGVLGAVSYSSSLDASGNLSSSSFSPVSSSSETSSIVSSAESENIYAAVSESVAYTTRDSVAAYICKFGKLPFNYRTKDQAESLYVAQGNSFTKWNFNPWTTLGVMVGGDSFSNSGELLPENTYHECDVDYYAANRGTKRLVYAESCFVYYTADHYGSFTAIYNGSP